MMTAINKIKSSKGFSLLEVLITLVITLVGLLGIAALQIKAQTLELESYQRAQALIILSDIVDKININRETVSCFEITTNTTSGTPYVGTAGSSHIGTPTCTAGTAAYNTQAVAAINEIDDILEGSAESLAGSDVGAMIGARACISYDSSTEISGTAGTGLYTVAISWQGMGDSFAPTINCANNEYGAETKRRTVAVTTRIANLN